MKLFLVQRNALFSPVEVSFIEPDDEPALRRYLGTMHGGEYHANFVLSAAKEYQNESTSEVYPFVIRCLDTIIGVCVIQLRLFLV